jgi:coenzyme F420-reducing hydrogenase delta subunit
MDKHFKPKITLFHCINAFNEGASLPLTGADDFEMKIVKLPCSGMVKDVFLLRAFEAGSDGVLVLVCPEGQCRYLEGNIRAKKRVEWVQNLLDEIGLNGKRLSICNISFGDKDGKAQIIKKTLKDLDELGPNPAA